MRFVAPFLTASFFFAVAVRADIPPADTGPTSGAASLATPDAADTALASPAISLTIGSTASHLGAATTQPNGTTQPAEGVPAPANKSSAQELDEFLLLITGNNTPEARELGARSLLRSGSDEAARRLIEVLKGSNDTLAKQAICRAIINTEQTPPALLDPLLNQLGRSPPEVAQLIPPTLRRFDSSAVIPRLRALGGDEKQPIESREAATRTLGLLGEDQQAVAALIDLLSASGESVPVIALDALSDAAGVRFIDAASARTWWDIHREKKPLDWLRDVNQRRRDEIQRMRMDREAVLGRLVAALRETYNLTPDASQPQKLAGFLRDDSAAVRGLGLDIINGLITDRREISPDIRSQVLKMVGDTNPAIRRRAAALVGDLRPPSSGERLSNALAVELDPVVRSAQVTALGRLDDAAVIPALIARMDDPSRVVVAEAATAIGQIARRGGAAAGAAGTVIETLLKRFERIAPGDDEMAERFIEAMGRIGAEEFRPIFIAQMDESRSARVRSAAITAYTSYTGSAEQIRRIATAKDPEVRLAVVQSLGRCGRSREDLDALGYCIDAAQEPIAAVREKAWESYLVVLRRLPIREQLDLAERFNRPNDAASQRRRADILLAIKNANDRTEPLSAAMRLNLLDRLASAQSSIRDYAGEVKSLTEALPLTADLDAAVHVDLHVRLIEALLHASQDDAAMARFSEFAQDAADGPFRSRLADAILREARARLDHADSAAEFVRLYDLIRLAETPLKQTLPDSAERLAEIRASADEARRGTINRLLDTLSTDADAEVRLLAFGRESVIPEIAARLSRDGASRPALEEEARLIDVARKIAKDWPGYAAGAPEMDRREAVELLKSITSGPNVTTPATNGQ